MISAREIGNRFVTPRRSAIWPNCSNVNQIVKIMLIVISLMEKSFLQKKEERDRNNIKSRFFLAAVEIRSKGYGEPRPEIFWGPPPDLDEQRVWSLIWIKYRKMLRNATRRRYSKPNRNGGLFLKERVGLYLKFEKKSIPISILKEDFYWSYQPNSVQCWGALFDLVLYLGREFYNLTKIWSATGSWCPN